MSEVIAIGYDPTGLVSPVFPLTDPAMTYDHDALYRFYTYTDGNRVVGDTLANGVIGHTPATVTSVGGAGHMAIGPVTKGALWGSGSQAISLPSSFDLLDADDDEEVVITVGFSIATIPASGVYAIAGKWTSTAVVQWGLFVNAGKIWPTFTGLVTTNIIPSPLNGTSYLITLHFRRVVNGARQVNIWVDDALVANYTFVPGSGGANAPVVGLNGSIAAPTGLTVHEAQVFTPPAGYDPSAWIAAERAKLTADVG